MHLLLVDDEPSLLQLLGQHLARLGHTVETAANIEQAQQLHGPFDAAILDWTLPDGNASVIAEVLLANDARIHIVYTSGYPLDPSSRRERVHILQKPYLPRTLVELLKTL